MPTAPHTDLRGRLLVATPLLADPNFDHTVVLLLDHGQDGAVGVVLNRPSTVSVEEALPQWQPLVSEPGVVFLGGPVQPEAVVGLAAAAGESATLQPVTPGVGIVDLRAEPVLLTGEVGVVRLFAGYAGWGAGQLEEELSAGGWFLIDADAADPFASDPKRLWVDVLVRQGGLFTNACEDPSSN